MDVSIIIVNYNTLALTKNCIDSIVKNTSNITYEIILIDNASNDGSALFLKKDNRIILVESKINLGFGRANNLGYERAVGKYIFLLNSDTILLNNAVEMFFKSAEELPEKYSCLGSILKDNNMKNTHSYGTFPKWTDEFYPKAKRRSSIISHVLPLKVDYITGAAIFIRRRVIERLGLFDPDFFLYYEETDMQYRYNKMGYESYIIDGPLICHLEGSSNNNSLKKRILVTKGYFMFLKKRLNSINYLCVRIIILLKRSLYIFKNENIKDKISYLKVIADIK